MTTDHIQGNPLLEKQSLWQVVFPWVPLITSDYNILITSCNSLQNSDVNTFTSSCEFLKNVILEDFPAEVLLQRPFIVQTLLRHLLPIPSKYDIVISSLQALIRLTSCLLERLAVYQDPMFYVTEINTSSTLTTQLHLASLASQCNLALDNPVNDIRYSGDGQDGDPPSIGVDWQVTGAESSVGGPSPVQEDVETSQQNQLTIPLYCIKVFEGGLTLLKGHSMHVANLVTQLLKLVFKLMKHTFNTYVWVDDSEKALEAKNIVLRSLEAAGELLHYHQQCITNYATTRATNHRYIYSSLAYLVSAFLDVSLSHDLAKRFVPKALMYALCDLIFDFGWKISFPDKHTRVVEYVKHLNCRVYELYMKAESVGKSMHSSCRLLKNLSSHDALPEELWREVENCLYCLPFIDYEYMMMKLVTAYVESIAYCLQKMENVTPKSTFLLQLLTYPVIEIRVTAFKIISDLIHKILKVRVVMMQSSIWQLGAFLDDEIMNHVICGSLADENKEISKMSESIILALMQTWQQLPECLLQKLQMNFLRALPLLQSFTSHETTLGMPLFKLIEETSFLGHDFTPTEKLQICFRLLFLDNSRIRLEALTKIIFILTEENGSISSNLLFGLNEMTRKNISGLLLVEPVELHLKEDVHSDLSEKILTMKTYLDIIGKRNLESEVRSSALHQLAIVLQDRILHAKFLEERGLSIVKENLFSLSLAFCDHQNMSTEEDIFIACLQILTLVSLGDAEQARSLGNDLKLYKVVLQGLVFWCTNAEVRLASSQLFALLVFDHAISTATSNEGCVCLGIRSPTMLRYRWPVKIQEVMKDKFSKNATLESHCYPITATPLAYKYIRLSWNTAYFGSPLKYIRMDFPSYDHASSQWPQSLMSCQKEQLMTRNVLCECLLEDNLCRLSNATTRKEAYSSLHALTLSFHLYNDSEFLKSFLKHPWIEAFNKFFQIIPSCKQDEELFGEVLNFFTAILRLSCLLPEEMILYLWERMLSTTGPIQSHLQKLGKEDTMCSNTDFRFVTCQLLTFTSALVASSSEVLSDSLACSAKYSDTIYTLSIGLNLAGSPHFYNISHLEKTLTCLVHLTACANWSLQNSFMNSFELCERLLQILKEVVAAFHLGSPGSYMGKGVVCAAALCLRHIAEEMRHNSPAGWEQLWLHHGQPGQNEGEPRLDWLIPLLLDKNPEVRAGGVGVLVCLTTTDEGGQMVINHLHHLFGGVFGGVWVIAISLLLDLNEASIVREQVWI